VDRESADESEEEEGNRQLQQRVAELEKANAAWVIKQSALTPDGLAGLLADILTHPEVLSARAEAARALGHPDAAARLADLAETLSESEPA